MFELFILEEVNKYVFIFTTYEDTKLYAKMSGHCTDNTTTILQ